MDKKIKEILKHGIKTAGRTQLIRHIKGERLTQRQAILAKCADCTGYFTDGKLDCLMPDCPLYPFFPYKAPVGAFRGTNARETIHLSSSSSKYLKRIGEANDTTGN